MNMDSSNAYNGLKHESAERIFRLLQFLLANAATRHDVFEHLGSYYRIDTVAPHEQVSSRRVDRMFERDIQFLEEQGFEVKKVRVHALPTRYSIVKGSGPRTTFLFTRSEVDSLALLYNMFADPTRYDKMNQTAPFPLQPPRNPFAEDILSLIEKLVTMLPTEQEQHFARWIRRPYVYFNLLPVTNYIPHRETIEKVIQAISARQQICFTYMPARHKRESTSHSAIDPYYVIYMEGHFYLIGYSHARESFLEYRIDRIQGETIKVGPDMIDMQHRRSPIEFRFWIDSSIARPDLSQRWLTQTLEREEAYLDEQGREQRRVLVQATAYSDWRIIQQILRYGDKAELVEPLWLREKMRKVVDRMYRFYND